MWGDAPLHCGYDTVGAASVARRGYAGPIAVHNSLVFGVIGDELGDKTTVVRHFIAVLGQIVEDFSDELVAQTAAAIFRLDQRVPDDDATADTLVNHHSDDLVADAALVAAFALVIDDLHDRSHYSSFVLSAVRGQRCGPRGCGDRRGALRRAADPRAVICTI